jgi:transglutaminase-like putative cysteine protease
MRTAGFHFLIAVVLTLVGAESAVPAEFDKRFEGPYKITTTPPRRIRATVRSVYRYPNLVAQEWMVAYPLPPEFDGQPLARGRIEIVDAPFAELGRINDETALRQPLTTRHWVPESNEGARGFTVEATYDLAICRRTLEPGAPTPPVPPLTRAGRSAFLAPSNHFDFTSPKFRAWLRAEDLVRKPGERDMDFAYRAMEAMVRLFKYRFELRSDRSASAVCKAGWSDCGGLATVYVSTLRASGIPARCLTGRNLKPDGPHVRMDFHAEGVGWVPGDPAVAIGAKSADAGFGRERSDMVIMHFDLIRVERDYCWLQGIGAVRSLNEEAGTGAGMTLEHVMTVEPLSADDGPEPAPPPRDGARKRKVATARRRAQ